VTTANEVVLVTGANGALGNAVARQLAGAGKRVIALERSKSGASELSTESASLLRLRAGTSDVTALRAGLAKAEAELGATTGAVLTAGAWRGRHDFVSAEAEPDFPAVLDANLASVNVALRAVLPGMVERQRGSVVLIGSRAGLRPYDAPGDAAYAASKAAVIALGQSIAAEVLRAGVRVNVVLPSIIDTPANRKAMPAAEHARWVTTESLGEVIAFLLSEAARDISGAALPVYGRVGV
jgi:NAD(P)-dependent dehydrogenase (short-subunit alcohol dehydrogenase family)